MKCKNLAYDHEAHPYAMKFGGYCLQCRDAGIPELLDKIELLRKALEDIAANDDYGSEVARAVLETYK